MDRASRTPGCVETRLPPGNEPFAARQRKCGHAPHDANFRRLHDSACNGSSRDAHRRGSTERTRTRRGQLRRPLPDTATRRYQAPRIDASRRATCEVRHARPETAVSKILPSRIEYRKSRAVKFDALPNSGQYPRIAEHRRAINRTTRPAIRVESNSMLDSTASTARSQSNAKTAGPPVAGVERTRDRGGAAARRSRSVCGRASRRTSKYARRHCTRPGNAVPEHNSRFSFTPAAVRHDSLAARMSKLPRKYRLREPAARTLPISVYG
ncbi:hypothetical protein BTM_4628 [Burkholderia thailandensis 34]|nr:hypothetical protein BTM_4628 [Burkholderia thailandensis 34]